MAVKTISKLIEIEWKIEIGGTFEKKVCSVEDIFRYGQKTWFDCYSLVET